MRPFRLNRALYGWPGASPWRLPTLLKRNWPQPAAILLRTSTNVKQSVLQPRVICFLGETPLFILPALRRVILRVQSGMKTSTAAQAYM